MGLDKSNIFKLSDEEQERYRKDPFLDCFESTKHFAEALKQDIDTKETPHSLLLSAKFGMGKTFFSTRFTQYLRKNKYDVIYFSVWENDYMNEPFLAFSKAIVNYIHNKFTYEKYKDSMKDLFQVIENVVSAISLNFLCGSISVSSKELLEEFKNTDPIANFRKQLTDFISKIPKKKLVIIVDELDRCRPDYAMKTLECIKHFFDIEGLFIITPTNEQSLNDCIKSLYGIDNNPDSNIADKYFNKFFNDKRIIKKPTQEDYLFIVNQYITKSRLKEAFDKHLLSEQNGKFNSYKNLKNSFAEYSCKANLTIRELKDSSMELARICNIFYEPIRVQWLACLMAYRNIQKNYDFMYPLPKEHCFYKERYSGQKYSASREDIVNAKEYFSRLTTLKKISYYSYNEHRKYIDTRKYQEFISKYCNSSNLPNTYTDIYKILDELLIDIAKMKEFYKDSKDITDNLIKIEEFALNQKNITKQYQNKFGSDDNDDKRETNYKNIINNPDILYSIKGYST